MDSRHQGNPPRLARSYGLVAVCTLEVTDWSLFVNTAENTIKLADPVCSYIN
ncbi:hypothetical protein RRG08_062821, partial [Elysia crispata]